MINVSNEIMPLKKVILHRPGNELLNMTPSNLKDVLFDDIPYLYVAREEHDELAKILRINHVEVLYLEDLMAEVLDKNPGIRDRFIRQYVFESGIKTSKYIDTIVKYLSEFNNKDLVLKTMAGININELSTLEMDMNHSLVDFTTKDNTFLISPMPNLMFVRDLMTSIGNNISLNKMKYDIRSRESIYFEYIFNEHNDYKDILKYYNKNNTYNLEGGDIFNLSSSVLAVGISRRTEASGIEQLAMNIFNDKNSKIDTILAFNIPESKEFMHLDTVFAQVDYDKFLYYPFVMNTLEVFEIRKDVMEGIKIKKINNSLDDILTTYLKRDVILIPCGAGDSVISQREQWNDAVNVLCIAPGIVISYDRNNITNSVLRRYGVKVFEMKSSELSRGRGGPRCMVVPLIRTNE